jgi:hypothetical protein
MYKHQILQYDYNDEYNMITILVLYYVIILYYIILLYYINLLYIFLINHIHKFI